MNGIIKSCELNQERFELQCNPNYRLVIFGAVPHSSTGKSSSVIDEMKSHEGYPRVEVLSSNSEVTITKSYFKELLNRSIDEDFI